MRKTIRILTLILLTSALFTISRAAAEEADWKNLIRQGRALQKQGRHAQSIEKFKKAYQITHSRFGRLDLRTFQALDSLAFAYMFAGRMDNALSSYEKLKKAYEVRFGPKSASAAEALSKIGRIYYKTGRLSDAERNLKKALKLLRPYNDRLAWGFSLDCLQTLADVEMKKGRTKNALSYLEKALAVSLKTYGERHFQTRFILTKTGRIYLDENKYKKARGCFQKVVSAGDDLQTAYALSDLAECNIKTGNYRAAQGLLKRSVGILKNRGAAGLSLVLTRSRLASVCIFQKKYTLAEELLKKNLSELEKTPESHARYLAMEYSALGRLYKKAGRFEDAEKAYRNALEVSEKHLGPDNADTISVMTSLAYLNSDMARYGKARKLADELLSRSGKRYGPDSVEYGRSLITAANVLLRMYEIKKAERLYRKAFEVFQKSKTAKNNDVFTCCLGLADVNARQGRFEQAGVFLKRAGGILKNEKTPDPLSLAVSTLKLAELQFYLNRKSESVKNYKKGLALAENVLGRDSHALAMPCYNLAGIYYIYQDYPEASKYINRALEITEKNMGTGHPFYARCLVLKFMIESGKSSPGDAVVKKVESVLKRQRASAGRSDVDLETILAMDLHRKGRYKQAAKKWDECLDIIRTNAGEESLNFAFLSVLKARSLYKSGNYKLALAALVEGAKSERAMINTAFSMSNENEKMRFLSRVSGGYRSIVEMVGLDMPENPRAAGIALNEVLRRKGIIITAFADDWRRFFKSKKMKKEYEEYRRLTSLLASMTLNGPQGSRGEYLRRLEKTRNALARLENRIVASTPDAKKGRINFEKINWRRVSQRLPSGSVLVEYVHVNSGFMSKGKGGEYYFAFVISSSKGSGAGVLQPVMINLGDGRVIDRAVKYYLRDVKRFSTAYNRGAVDKKAERTAEKKLAKNARTLYNLLIKPIREKTGGRKIWFISPDSVISLAPFESLVDDTGAYFIEKNRIHYLSSGRDLLTQRTAALNDVNLIIADPDFGDASQIKADNGSAVADFIPTRKISGGIWSPLPGARREAKKIKMILKNEKVRIFTGKNATEAVLKNAKPPKRLHLATHGFFLEDTGVRIYDSTPLQLSFDRHTALRELAALKSGLVLAGVNRAKGNPANDGIVTALEITGLDLGGTDLVVLSACSTGVGVSTRGQGVLGLRSSFQAAGAQNVVMSLWNVADTETGELMADFYSNLKNGAGKSDALRQAKLSMIKRRRRKNGAAHPYFWAPFIMTGRGD